MALNKSMHPRNRYKDRPPDFAYLASKYPEFKQHVSVSLSGRVSVNFKEPGAVRALTCTLLKEDFGLTIDIPLERLIPTVPLRLNYIHWVEDIINYHSSDKSTVRRGIDIGTGASCIYPLLGATLNGWYFLATEVDDICFNYAKKNVEQNNLADLIKVVKVPQKTLLMDALKEESGIIYDFCMCNPPFFANEMEAQGVNSRNPRRPPPSSVNTGGITEIMAEGGELEFVKRIIHDSLQLKKRLRWYSCMLGKKCSLAPLKEELRIQGVPKVAHTEFYQGKTMRWALAWSFYDDVIIPNPPSKKRKLDKPRKPMLFTILETTVLMLKEKLNGSQDPAPSYVAVVTGFLKKILTDRKVEYKPIPSGKEEESLFLTAVTNSWVHNRRKKRKQMRQLRELPRAPAEDFVQMGKMENPTLKDDSQQGDQTPAGPGALDEKDKSTPDISNPISASSEPDPTAHLEDTNPESMEEETLALSDQARDTSLSQNTETDDHDSSEELNQVTGEGSHPVQGNSGSFLFKCLLNVKNEAPNVLVEMHWVEGQNKDLMNQLCTYLRNQLCRLASS
ncbi:PREDICTED: methyltransferase-like protein 16 [Nanorana parkeri]|uniref:methyltransferase-like protein 16 n=1 Tax=Nanorana parkeri TaxID=125878 RepID=UPI000854226C|nr:PREDICTED: methyltransferase-like protein 16 [Nanorana parkeri]XP_018409609.1 PREDICTED: methyltransferase-like protein 16 [Nanorana parkeri]